MENPEIPLRLISGEVFSLTAGSLLKGGKAPHPQDFSLTKKTARFTKGPISSLLRTENRLTTDIFVVKYTGRGLLVKRPEVLS